MEPRIISGDRIRAKRGKRTIREVARASGGIFTHSALSQWESGEYQPKMDKLPSLLNALGCSYEEISEPIHLALEQ